ncbi:MAG: tripartite tricarboxylate transporter substrate binding protein [Betaproteobacteria bacterium]|nr:tripartite tricarboxylate transporter substrate binding protein [Betaproteobacteria bacterium]
MTTNTLLGISAVAALAFGGVNAPAQEYPSKLVRFIVPYAPGGATDAVGRSISQKLTEAWGQQVVVDNRPGAQGNLGAGLGAKASPDGYTLVLTDTGTMAIAPWMHKNLSFHPLRDFVHITQASSQPYLVVAHPSLPAKSLKELAALAKAQPDTLTFASTSQGNRFSGELFKIMTRTRIIHVPYKGGGQAITDLLGGYVTLMFASPTSSTPHVNNKRLRGLAVTGPSRLPALPDVPTATEAGYPDLTVTSWYGVAVPVNTPNDIVAKLNAGILRALKLPDVITRLKSVGLEPGGNSSEEFTAYVKSEYERWGKVVKESGVAPE